ncbi:hypothetical protein SASPL_135576 [Salvia splendens]|uniref:Guanine nucleotide-binding protein subunit beta-2-like 1 protein n=1 Tax=Salvia splendens TaxID=180675 RepID=A0A8X8WZV9_SALSN|nr:hypothetical protein SASPL_135576 [Salvia splendens]
MENLPTKFPAVQASQQNHFPKGEKSRKRRIISQNPSPNPSSSHGNEAGIARPPRDNTLTKDDSSFGVATRRFTGHSHFVQDAVLSSDGQFALSASWVLQTGETARSFVGHAKDCKYTIQEGESHSDWVSCVRFSPDNSQPTVVSGSWDKYAKVWNLTDCKLRATLTGHTGYVNTVVVSPDGSLCASGGKDGVILLWDLSEGKMLYSLEAGSIVNALTFSPNRYWLCAATESVIKIWDLESKSVVADLKVDLKHESELARDDVGQPCKNKVIYCTSLGWKADGSTLFSGYTDGIIRVWGIGGRY